MNNDLAPSGFSADLTGKVALVTGGSRGLGREMALALGRAGAKVVVSARRRPDLDAAVQYRQQHGVDAWAIANDVSHFHLVPEFVDQILSRHGAIDILVTNAGATGGEPAESYPPEAWIKVVDANLNGTWALTQGGPARSMIPRTSGSVIIVTVAVGLGGCLPNAVSAVAYNASKAALINLAKTLAGEWGPFNVCVNALVPGWFITKISRDTLQRLGSAVDRRLPLGQIGESQDLVGPVLFLSTDVSRYITGQALAVDVGMSAASFWFHFPVSVATRLPSAAERLH